MLYTADFWSQQTPTIIVGIVSSLLAVFLVHGNKMLVLFIFLFWTRWWRLRALFSFKCFESIYVVNTIKVCQDNYDVTNGDMKKRKRMYIPPSNDPFAASSVIQSLRGIYRSSIIHKLVGEQDSPVIGTNIVTIGGPLHNTTTEHYLKCIKEIVKFEDNTLLVNGKPYNKDVDNDKDHGLVVRMDEPIHGKGKVVIVAGCGSHGVLAASLLFDFSRNNKKLMSSFNKKRTLEDRLLNRDYIAVISCTVLGHDVSDVQVCHYVNI